MRTLNDMILEGNSALCDLSKLNLIKFNFNANDLNALSKESLETILPLIKENDRYYYENLVKDVKQMMMEDNCYNGNLIDYYKDEFSECSFWYDIHDYWFDRGFKMPKVYEKLMPMLSISRQELKKVLNSDSVTEEYILKYIKEIETYNLWDDIKVEILSADTIIKYFGLLNPNKISKLPNLDKSVISTYSDKIDWYYLTEYWNGWNEEDNIKEFYDFLEKYDGMYLCCNKNVSDELKSKYEELFKERLPF